MRTLIIVIAVVIILVLVGWVTFSRGPDRSSINVETETIKKDAQSMMESGSQMLDEAKEAIDEPDAQEPAQQNPNSSGEPAAPLDSPVTR